MGLNGPRTPKAERFDSAAAVRASWVAAALSNDVDATLAKVDFDHEVVLAAAVGERTNVNTSLRIARVRELVTYVEIGVNMPNCGQPHGYSYPFVLLAVPKPTSPYAAPGYDYQNYGNGCAPPLSGSPHDGGS